MNRIFIIVFLAVTVAAQAQNVVPFLKKNGKYILVDAATMKPIA